MKHLHKIPLVFALAVAACPAFAANTLHDKTAKGTPATTDETYLWDVTDSTLKKATFGTLPVSTPQQTALDAKQDADDDLTTFAGITPSANIVSVLNAVNYAAIRTLLGLGISDNPSFNSVHASGGNLAAANAQVTKKWISGLSYTADFTSVIYGGKHYICTSTHTADSTTEPGVGASWATVWEEQAAGGTDDQTASEVTTTTTSFDGNLSPADDTVQKALDTIDDMTVSGSGMLEDGNYTPTGTWNWASATVTWPTFNQSTTGNAATSTALAANGTNCSAGQAALGVDASGNAEGCWTPDSGAMTWPSSAGVAVYGGSSAWGTSLTVGAAANNLVQLNGSGQLPAVSAALLTNFPTLNQNTTGTAGGLSGTPDITVGDIYFAHAYSTALDGDQWGEVTNTVAIIATATLGRYAWLTDRFWIANGTNWTSRWILDSSMIGAAGGVQAYDDNNATASSTTTFTGKSLDTAATGNNITVPLNGLLDDSMTNPTASDAISYRKLEHAVALSSIHCQAEGGGTITLTFQECSSTNTSCADIDGALTCDADGAEDLSVTDSSLAADSWIRVVPGTPSGTVTGVSWSPRGTQTW